MKSHLDLEKLKNHFTYSWWKYLIVLVVGIFGIDLLYTVTEPRVPDNQKIEVIVCGSSLEQNFSDYLEGIRPELPDILQTSVNVIPDDTDAIQYLTVRIATQGGDLYLLPRNQFDNIMSNGALLPLEDDLYLINILSGLDYPDADIDRLTGNLEALEHQPEKLDQQDKKIYDELLLALGNLDLVWNTEANSRDMHVYGIPARYLPGLDQYFLINDGYISVLRYGKNLDNARKCLRIIVRDMMSADIPETGN